MKATIRDNLREIKISRGRFISIFMIAAIGVAFFAGIWSSAPDMLHTADKYYKDNNLMDIRIISPKGFTDKDVENISKIDGIDGIYPARTKDVITVTENSKIVLRVHGIPMGDRSRNNKNYINQVNLIKGRLPEQNGECLIENKNFIGNGLKIGDKITLESGLPQPLSESMKDTQYTVVGIVRSPYYISLDRGTSQIGQGTVSSFIFVPEEDFKPDIYTDIFITVKGAKELDSYKDEYFDLINKVKEKLTSPQWVVLDRNSHFGYGEIKNSADNMGTIAAVFPAFFFFVAVLVCLTTMTRMVDEQRGAIGTYKALGYPQRIIMQKYIFYSGLASLGGGITGCATGIIIFPTVIFNAWKLVYALPPISYVFQPLLIILSILAVVIVVIAATFFVCKKELSETPAILMRPKSPKSGKKIFLERFTFIWKRFTFIQKVTARNIFRYKKRFIMTVIGIAGCTALLLSGFGLYDSISEIARLHFHEIHLYDGIINYSSAVPAGERENLEGVFEKYGGISETLSSCQYYVTLNNGKDNINALVTVPENALKFKSFINLRDMSSKKEIELSASGVVIDIKLSKEMGLKTGDMIFVQSKTGIKKDLKITGIMENYIRHYIIMSPEAYKTAFNEDAEKTTLLLKLNNISKEQETALGEKLMSDSRIASVSFTTGIEDNVNDTVKSLNMITYVLIISAGTLAFVVLYNLTNVSISERLREIAAIKVLGFYDKEVSAYVYRENMVLTIIGAIIGTGLGILLHSVVMSVINMKDIMFGANINTVSFILSIILTIFFSIAVNFVMYWKLKKIPMVESLKSID